MSSSTTKPSAAASSTLRIDALDEQGRGVGDVDGVRLHVPGALPGEAVEAQIEHRSPHRAEAFGKLLRVVSPSPERIPGVCRATGRCGGCPLGILDYSAQLEHKHAILSAHLAPLDLANALPPMVPSPRPLGYRGQAKWIFGSPQPGSQPCLGAYAPRSHDVVDLAGCRVVEPVIEEVRAAMLEALLARRVIPYDERTGAGLLAYVVVRANAAGQVLVTLVGPELDALEPLASLRTIHPAIAGVAANQRPSGNAIFGRATRSLSGADALDEHIGVVSIRLSPTAFFQVNRDVAGLIYAELAERIGPTAHGQVVDAFAGVGGIALTLARGGREVVGIEVNADAVRDATRAAEAQGARARFVAADAAAGLMALGSDVDTLVVNPPRRGLERTMLDAIAAVAPRQVAYVSCDPATLVRDLEVLSAQGLTPYSVRGFDMHPQTAHIETLAVLRR